MERQGGRSHAQLLTDCSRVHALRSGLDEQPEDRQPGFVPNGCEKLGGGEGFLDSNSIEMMQAVNAGSLLPGKSGGRGLLRAAKHLGSTT